MTSSQEYQTRVDYIMSIYETFFSKIIDRHTTRLELPYTTALAASLTQCYFMDGVQTSIEDLDQTLAVIVDAVEVTPSASEGDQ